MMERDRQQEEIPSLARRARDGDPEALAALVLRLRAPLFALAYAELRHYDDAQDAVAAALLRLCRSIEQLRDPARAMAWIQTITRNEAFRLGRARGARQARETTWNTDWEEEAPSTDTLRLDIERALRMLPQDQARAASLFYLEELPVAEVARQMSRPVGTIKYWLHMGRSRLAEEMKEYAPVSTNTTPAAVLITADASATIWAEAIRQGGWSEVRILPTFGDAAGALRSLRANGTGALQNARFIVLDHRLGERSAFELHPLLRGISGHGSGFLTMLLLEAIGSSEEQEALILATYVSGFDLCLTKPFPSAELERFAIRARTQPSDTP